MGSKQPFIFRRQIISIIAISVFTLCFMAFGVNQVIQQISVTYLIALIFFTLIPYFRYLKPYPFVVHLFIYYAPLYSILLFHKHVPLPKLNFISRHSLIGVTLFFLLLFFCLPEINKNITGVLSKTPISRNQFLCKTAECFVALLSEEVYYRYFLIGLLLPFSEILAVTISTVLFVFSHFMNRWANKYFSIKNYISIAALSMILGFIYVKTLNLLMCVILHLAYNLSDFISDLKRLRVKSMDEDFFNDY